VVPIVVRLDDGGGGGGGGYDGGGYGGGVQYSRPVVRYHPRRIPYYRSY